MATKKTVKAAAPAAPALNLQLLAAIVTATNGPNGYMFTGIEANELVAAGYAERNPNVTDKDGNTATRATQAGVLALPKRATDAPIVPAFDTPTEEPEKQKVVVPEGGFKIVVGVVCPESKRGAAFGDKKYPFDSMPVNGSFFVPATAAMPDPVKKISSSVSSATRRYAQPDPTGATRLNNKGEAIIKMIPTRQYCIRAVEDGAPWGYTGQKGAAIFRTA